MCMLWRVIWGRNPCCSVKWTVFTMVVKSDWHVTSERLSVRTPDWGGIVLVCCFTGVFMCFCVGVSVTDRDVKWTMCLVQSWTLGGRQSGGVMGGVSWRRVKGQRVKLFVSPPASYGIPNQRIISRHINFAVIALLLLLLLRVKLLFPLFVLLF